ncbi:VanW family protein [Pseudoneobacillus rhizosphaerae]|uniref:G5 domain-containing protein n=1 Tax=Pseudoneobacillus rhizosphaerae TaxID=2880968 RepID=A0A9C7G9G1_9BACI|nr:VanW family protein [Pseudoneobacillus rhizosphaerae]CAG9607925.1 hypothetical protein NEOCIP111885_01617 [Pseudoneobacillus rhizosphaerae]
MKITFGFRINLVILISTFLIFSFSHYGVLAFESIVTKSSQFSENTWIGPENVSGLEKVEALQLLTTRVSEWQANNIIQLSYLEESVPFPIENIHFMIDESLQHAKSGSKNELLINIEAESLNTALENLTTSSLNDELDVEKLKLDIFSIANSFETGTIEINLGDYLLSPVKQPQIIHTITIPTQEMNLQNFGATIFLEPKSTFSLLGFLEKQGFIELDSYSLGLLSSGIYQAILPTNFQVLERHIGMKLPEGISAGYEAKIDSSLQMDLAFYNPNEDEYTIEIYSDESTLTLDVLGIPFLYQYKIVENGLQEFAPKTIKQYSPLLEPGNSTIKREGQKGLYIELSRLVKDYNDVIIEQHPISKDYYPPVHQVQVFGLALADSGNQGSGSSGLIINEHTNYETGSNNSESTNSPNDDTVTDSDAETEPLWGKPDEIDK